MKVKEIILNIMEKKGVKKCDMAYALNVPQTTIWDRLNPRKSTNMTVVRVNEMLRVLGYELVIMPHGKSSKLADAYVVEDSDGK